jgi:hypothetical protein
MTYHKLYALAKTWLISFPFFFPFLFFSLFLIRVFPLEGKKLLHLLVVKLKVNLAKYRLIRSFILFYPFWQVQFSWKIIILWKSLLNLTGNGSQNVLSMLGELVQRVSLKLHMMFHTWHVQISFEPLEFRHQSLCVSQLSFMNVAALKPWGTLEVLLWNFTPERYKLMNI